MHKGINTTLDEGQTPIVGQKTVRRLTPTECERLQGFQDNYTNIPWRKAIDSPDGPRYKALGNSMAVPVMKWIGERLELQMPKPAG
jgi:DNA (cytosine-5)-methyltransferase 1